MSRSQKQQILCSQEHLHTTPTLLVYTKRSQVTAHNVTTIHWTDVVWLTDLEFVSKCRPPVCAGFCVGENEMKWKVSLFNMWRKNFYNYCIRVAHCCEWVTCPKWNEIKQIFQFSQKLEWSATVHDANDARINKIFKSIKSFPNVYKFSAATEYISFFVWAETFCLVKKKTCSQEIHSVRSIVDNLLPTRFSIIHKRKSEEFVSKIWTQSWDAGFGFQM